MNARQEADVQPSLLMRKVRDSSGAKYTSGVMPQVDRVVPPQSVKPTAPLVKPTDARQQNVVPSHSYTGASSAAKTTASRKVEPTVPSFKAPSVSSTPIKSEPPRTSVSARVESSDSRVEQSAPEGRPSFSQTRSLFQNVSSPATSTPAPLKQESSSVRNSISKFNQESFPVAPPAPSVLSHVPIPPPAPVAPPMPEPVAIPAPPAPPIIHSTPIHPVVHSTPAHIPPPPSKIPTSSRTAKCLYDYDATAQDEISIRENELITDIIQVDESWWEGTNPRGEKGLFPANYVELVQGGVVEEVKHEEVVAPPPAAAAYEPPQPVHVHEEPVESRIQSSGKTAVAQVRLLSHFKVIYYW